MVTFTVALMLHVTHTAVRTVQYSTCACIYCTVAGNGKSFYDKRVANEQSHWWRINEVYFNSSAANEQMTFDAVFRE